MMNGPTGLASAGGPELACIGGVRSKLAAEEETRTKPGVRRPSFRVPGPRNTTSVAFAASLDKALKFGNSSAAICKAAFPTTPSTIVPRMPIVATGELMLAVPLPPALGRPDMNRKAPLVAVDRTGVLKGTRVSVREQ